MRKLLPLALAFTLSFSSVYARGLPYPLTPFTPPKTAVTTPLAQIKQFTLDDLKAALADSNAQVPPPGTSEPAPYVATTAGVTVTAGSDTRHGNCWAALIDFKTNWTMTNPLPGQLGLALLQQKIFDAKATAGKPILPDYVTHNCVDTFNDAGMELARIVGLLGITIPRLPVMP